MSSLYRLTIRIDEAAARETREALYDAVLESRAEDVRSHEDGEEFLESGDTAIVTELACDECEHKVISDAIARKFWEQAGRLIAIRFLWERIELPILTVWGEADYARLGFK